MMQLELGAKEAGTTITVCHVVDLLDQAAALLSHQMEFRVKGAEKARVGTRLAILKLMDRRPEDALDALANSDFIGISAALLG